MKRKLIAKRVSAVALATVMAAAPVSAFATELDGHWAKDTLIEWQSKGLISGFSDGTLKPNSTVTRAQFVKLANAALGYSVLGTINFDDVSVDDWFYEDVNVAVNAGYANGTSATTFAPNAEVTREQAARFIYNALGLAPSSVMGFTDAGEISSWAQEAVGAMANAGYLLGGTDGSFAPKKAMTRAEAVSFLDRVMKGDNSSYVEPDAENSVTITNSGEVLQDEIINGDLVISSAVGDGEVYLDNVTVNGNMYVQGGGSDSVYAKNVKVTGTVYVDKEAVRLEVSENTSMPRVEILKYATIEGTDSFEGTIGTVTFNTEISKSYKTTIDVDVTSIVLNVPVSVAITSEVGSMTVAENATGAIVDLSADATVGTITANAGVSITGSGTIETLNANANGITVDKNLTIEEEVAADGVTTETSGTTSSGGGTTTGSSGNSGGSSSDSSSGGGSTDTETPQETSKIFYVHAGVAADGDTVSVDGVEGVGYTTIEAAIADATGADDYEIIVLDTAPDAASMVAFGAMTIDGAVSAEYTGTGSITITLKGATLPELALTASSTGKVIIAADHDEKIEAAFTFTGAKATLVIAAPVETTGSIEVAGASAVVIEEEVEITVTGEVTTVTVDAAATITGGAGADIATVEANADVTIDADVTTVTVDVADVTIDGTGVITTVDANADVIIEATGVVTLEVNTADVTVSGGGEIATVVVNEDAVIAVEVTAGIVVDGAAVEITDAAVVTEAVVSGTVTTLTTAQSVVLDDTTGIEIGQLVIDATAGDVTIDVETKSGDSTGTITIGSATVNTDTNTGVTVTVPDVVEEVGYTGEEPTVDNESQDGNVVVTKQADAPGFVVENAAFGGTATITFSGTADTQSVYYTTDADVAKEIISSEANQGAGSDETHLKIADATKVTEVKHANIGTAIDFDTTTTVYAVIAQSDLEGVTGTQQSIKPSITVSATATVAAADYTELNAEISESTTLKSNTVTSADGTDIDTDKYWVTTAQMETFEAAITAAQAVLVGGNNAATTQAEITAATGTLTTARLAFNTQRAEGTKGESDGNQGGNQGDQLDKTALNAIVQEAAGEVEANYTDASWELFEAAITVAAAMGETTQEDINAKVEAYEDAIKLLVVGYEVKFIAAQTAPAGTLSAVIKGGDAIATGERHASGTEITFTFEADTAPGAGNSVMLGTAIMEGDATGTTFTLDVLLGADGIDYSATAVSVATEDEAKLIAAKANAKEAVAGLKLATTVTDKETGVDLATSLIDTSTEPTTLAALQTALVAYIDDEADDANALDLITTALETGAEGVVEVDDDVLEVAFVVGTIETYAIEDADVTATENGITVSAAVTVKDKTYTEYAVEADVVTVTVTLGGKATADGTMTVGLTSTEDVASITAPDVVIKAVEKDDQPADTFAFTFAMPAKIVDDLTVTLAFEETKTYEIGLTSELTDGVTENDAAMGDTMTAANTATVVAGGDVSIDITAAITEAQEIAMFVAAAPSEDDIVWTITSAEAAVADPGSETSLVNTVDVIGTLAITDGTNSSATSGQTVKGDEVTLAGKAGEDLGTVTVTATYSKDGVEFSSDFVLTVEEDKVATAKTEAAAKIAALNADIADNAGTIDAGTIFVILEGSKVKGQTETDGNPTIVEVQAGLVAYLEELTTVEAIETFVGKFAAGTVTFTESDLVIVFGVGTNDSGK